MNTQLSEEGNKALEKQFADTRRAWEILDIIVGEWDSDPMSVQCFDLRIVQEAKNLVAEYKKRVW